MIGKLKGVVDEINLDHIILDVGGVGYKVFLSNSTMGSLVLNKPLVLNIDMYVREDQMLLYGFSSKLEQKWFNLLQTVQGVGSRVALSILSHLKPEQLYYAILSDDQKAIKSIPGIGPKIAARIINELKSHPELTTNSSSPIASTSSPSLSADSMAINSDIDAVLNDALGALSSLGFSRAETLKILMDIKASSNDTPMLLEDVIRLALAKLVSNK